MFQDSPFYPSNGRNNSIDNGSLSFSIYVEPYLNSYYKTYQNIITLSNMPAGPLRQMVARISTPKLSPFQELSPLSDNVYGCRYALMRYPTSNGFSIKSRDSFMVDIDVPALLDYLNSNGYHIDTQVTRILQKSNLATINGSGGGYSGKRTLVCMARFVHH